MSAPPALAATTASPTSDRPGLARGTQRADRRAQVLADLALLGVAAIWGGTFVMVKESLAVAGPFTFLAVRFGIAAVVVLPLLARGRARRALTGPSVAAGFALGVAEFAGYAFQTAGLQFTTAARAGFLTGLSVVIVPLLATLVLRRRLPGLVWAGLALALAGLALLSLGESFSGGAADTTLGDLLVLGCAGAFAVQIVLVGEFAPRFPLLPLTVVQFLAVALFATIGAVAGEQPRLDQLGPVLPAALFTGLFATVVAFLVQVRAQRFTTATHTALLFSTEPVFAALFAYVLVGEVLGPPALAGCGLILAGMLVAQLGEART